MKHAKLLAAIIMICFVKSVGFAQSTSKNKRFELYILIGQSNMAGRGPITDSLKNETNDSVFSFNKNKEWIIARHPLHFDKPMAAGVGPGLAFGMEMAKHNPKIRIGLIPCAVGGTPIENWLAGAYDTPTNTHPYDDAVERIEAAMQYGIIKGVIWHQGESNASPEKSTRYLEKLQDLIQRVRALVGNPNLPFVAGDLGDFFKGHELINNHLKQLPAKVNLTDVISAAGLTDKGDNTHFDGPSADQLGRRYAAKMIELQKKATKTSKN